MHGERPQLEAARALRLLETMPVGFISWDAQWRCAGVNAQGARLCGIAAEDLYGRSLWDLFPHVRGTEFETVYRRVAATGEAEHLEIFYPEPLNRWLDIHVSADGDGVAAYYVDVTVRHRDQDRLDLLAAHDRSVAQTLQRVLLPTLPVIEGVDIAARYLTAQDSDQVGGDWYDAVPGADGALSLLIGDVAGHDIDAAATMGQLRSMLRMSFWEHGDEPSQIVSRLDRAARDLGVRTTASLVFAEIQPPTGGSRTRPVRLTNAGHPPPIMVAADGRTRLLHTGTADLLLGVDPRTARHDHRFELPAGATLVLYTDGLVETRRHSLDDGIDRLRVALARHRHDVLADRLDAVIAELVGDQADDDVAVIAVRFGS